MLAPVAAPPSPLPACGAVNGPQDLLEAQLPEFDVSDCVARVVEASPASTWRALLDADLIEVGRRKPVVGALGAMRMLPELTLGVLRGAGLPPKPESLRLREMARTDAAAGEWILLGERPGEELALGLVGKFWRPVIEYAAVEPERFRDFAEPGWAKTVYDLRVAARPDGRTLLSGTMRTATTDEVARRWFHRYWTLGVGSGAHVLVAGLLEVVAEAAAPSRK